MVLVGTSTHFIIIPVINKLLSRHDARHICVFNETDIAVERNPGLSYLPFFGGNQHDPIRGFGTIYGGCAGIFQDVDGLDVIRRSEEHTSELQSLMRSSYAVL